MGQPIRGTSASPCLTLSKLLADADPGKAKITEATIAVHGGFAPARISARGPRAASKGTCSMGRLRGPDGLNRAMDCDRL